MRQVVIENPVPNSPFEAPQRHFRFDEALETAIYITEVAGKYGDAWIENDLRKFNEDANPLLLRVAFKTATGSGTTVVCPNLAGGTSDLGCAGRANS